MRKVSVLLPYYNRKDILLLTMDSFEHIYGGEYPLEVVIVDDGSSDQFRVDGIEDDYSFDIVTYRIKNKSGINPCFPYNVGARIASGDIFVLSSPEIFHTKNMFELSNDFDNLVDFTYFLFSVFCLTDVPSIDRLLDKELDFKFKLSMIQEMEKNFIQGMGFRGYDYANSLGAWYLHSRYRPTYRNFFTAITRNDYYKLSGFDERFRFGSGFDDDEFLIRVKEYMTKFQWFDEAVSIHINHEVVEPERYSGKFRKNRNIFNATRVDTYRCNDEWGRDL